LQESVQALDAVGHPPAVSLISTDKLAEFTAEHELKKLSKLAFPAMAHPGIRRMPATAHRDLSGDERI
jgi:hypothetical protein